MTEGSARPADTVVPEIQATWDRFRAEAEAAANYTLWGGQALGGPGRNAVIDGLMPGLLLLRAAAILDDALEALVAQRNLQHPQVSRSRMKLAHRIDCAEWANAVTNAVSLRRIKDDRNDLAHEPNASRSWDQLRTDVGEIEAALFACGAISKTHTYETHFERSAVRESQRKGYRWDRTYTLLVLQDGTPKLRMEAVQSIE